MTYAFLSGLDLCISSKVILPQGGFLPHVTLHMADPSSRQRNRLTVGLLPYRSIRVWQYKKMLGYNYCPRSPLMPTGSLTSLRR